MNTPLFGGTALRFRGNGDLIVSTPGGDGGGFCIGSVGMGNASCAGGCLHRRRLFGNNVVGMSVDGRPGVGENAGRRSVPCSFSGRRWSFVR